MIETVNVKRIDAYKRMCKTLSEDKHMKLVQKREEAEYRFRTYFNKVTHEYRTIRYINPRYRK